MTGPRAVSGRGPWGMIAVLAVLVVGSGCSARSSYLRQEVPDDELVWAFDDGLELRTGSNQPVAEPPGWEGLADRVACVPEAAAFAARAEDDGSLGTGLIWGALGLGIGGVGLFSTVGLLGIVVTLGAPALAIAVAVAIVLGVAAAAVGAVVMAGVGGYYRRRALPEALDAVNAYNDGFLEEPACGRRSDRGGPDRGAREPAPERLPEKGRENGG